MSETDDSAFVALLRGINLGSHNKVLMPELRALAEGLGWLNVQTYIQSGNLVFRSSNAASDLEADLERSLTAKYGATIPVIIRSAIEWRGYLQADPFPQYSETEGNRVMLVLSKAPPREGALEALRARAAAGEQIQPIADGFCIYYAAGAGTSKLSPGLLDRAVGSPVTTRNWRTVKALAVMTQSIGVQE